MLYLKADGQAEQKLLELLLSPGSQVLPAAGPLVPAATQQQLDSMRYLIQTQQAQLEQAQAAIAGYEQSLTALTTQQPQLLLSPASGSSGPALDETPRRYITGGLGTGGLSQVNAVTPAAQTAQLPERRQRPSLLARGWPKRMAKTSLLLALFCLVSWGVFEYAAPPAWNWLFPTTTEPSSAPEKADEPPSDPQSNLDAPSSTGSPGSAASKAGTQPNALDL